MVRNPSGVTRRIEVWDSAQLERTSFSIRAAARDGCRHPDDPSPGDSGRDALQRARVGFGARTDIARRAPIHKRKSDFSDAS